MRRRKQQFVWFFLAFTLALATMRFSKPRQLTGTRRSRIRRLQDEEEEEEEDPQEVESTVADTNKAKTTNTEHYNVWGDALQPCSLSGMARTGGSGGSGQCIISNNDSSSSYSDTSETICIDMTSLVFGDYCKVVGATSTSWSSSSSSTTTTTTSNNNNDVQGDANDYSYTELGGASVNQEQERDPWWWCSSEDEDLPCQEGGGATGDSSSSSSISPTPSPTYADASSSSSNDGEMCSMENWCVTPKSFASYVHKAGCLAIGNIVCESLNREALRAYDTATNTQYSDALDCLIDRCGLFLKYSSSRSNDMTARWLDMAGFAAIMMGLVLGSLMFLELSSRELAFEEPLTEDCELEPEFEPSIDRDGTKKNVC